MGKLYTILFKEQCDNIHQQMRVWRHVFHNEDTARSFMVHKLENSHWSVASLAEIHAAGTYIDPIAKPPKWHEVYQWINGTQDFSL